MDSRKTNISGAFRGSAMSVIMLSKGARESATILRSLCSLRTHTIPPWRSTNIVDERRVDPCLLFDLRIQAEHRCGIRFRQSHVDQIPELLARKPKSQVDGVLSSGPLD